MPNSVAGKEEEEEEGWYATCSTRSMNLSSNEENINLSHVFLICPSKMPPKLSLAVPAFPSPHADRDGKTAEEIYHGEMYNLEQANCEFLLMPPQMTVYISHNLFIYFSNKMLYSIKFCK